MSAWRASARILRSPARPLLQQVSTLLLRAPSLHRCFAANLSKSIEREHVIANNPVSQRLLDTGLWKARVRVGTSTAERPKPRPRSKRLAADKTRVHISSEGLCDDILSYIGHDLERHRGCDLIDLYPGAGVWSTKLNDFLKPRSHILMEPDAKFYEPFLQPLLDRPDTTLVPKSGISWKDLSTVLTPEYLPHQKVREGPELLERNDTLLVTANIAFHPRKRYNSFDSIAKLVFHQFVDSIRTSTLFQRYGQVRMLVWSRAEDTDSLVAKNVQKRKKLAVAAEVYCEWVREVCVPAVPEIGYFGRDQNMNVWSCAQAYLKSQEDGRTIPAGRETETLAEVKGLIDQGQKIPVPGKIAPFTKGRFSHNLQQYRDLHEAGKIGKKSPDYHQYQIHETRSKYEGKKSAALLQVTKALEVLKTKLARAAEKGKEDPKMTKKLTQEWEDLVNSHVKQVASEFVTYYHNLHSVQQDPPMLHHDRKIYEPLASTNADYFPRVECTLVDIQPKPPNPLLRQHGAGSDRGGEVFELLVGYMLISGTTPIPKMLDSMWPGAADWIIPRWKSAHDITQGGVPMIPSRLAALTPRMLNQRQWEELLELWMDWPFRPDFPELISRFHESEQDDEEESHLEKLNF